MVTNTDTTIVEEKEPQAQLTVLEDQFMMPMVMVLKIMLKKLERNLIDSTFQITSSQPKISTIPTTEIFQAMLERQNTWEGPITNPHTSIQNCLMVNSEQKLVLNQEVMEPMQMSSTEELIMPSKRNILIKISIRSLITVLKVLSERDQTHQKLIENEND